MPAAHRSKRSIVINLPVSYTHLLFEENKVIFNERKEKAIEEICKHVGFIK